MLKYIVLRYKSFLTYKTGCYFDIPQDPSNTLLLFKRIKLTQEIMMLYELYFSHRLKKNYSMVLSRCYYKSSLFCIIFYIFQIYWLVKMQNQQKQWGLSSHLTQMCQLKSDLIGSFRKYFFQCVSIVYLGLQV